LEGGGGRQERMLTFRLPKRLLMGYLNWETGKMGRAKETAGKCPTEREWAVVSNSPGGLGRQKGRGES